MISLFEYTYLKYFSSKFHFWEIMQDIQKYFT